MEVPNGASKTAYLISGEFQPYDKGPVIEIANCEFIGGTSAEAALPPAALAGYCACQDKTGNGFQQGFFNLSQGLFLMNAMQCSRKLHEANLKPSLLQPLRYNEEPA